MGHGSGWQGVPGSGNLALDQSAPLPVTVIGGYLGAGKTTLVNRLLRQADGLRLAVLVNEFGELPIDADLIESRDENVINIAGGCVCCSYGSDLIAALKDIEHLDTPPDHLLIEASGVALPDSIAQSVGLIEHYAVDGIIVLADAETVRERGTDRYLSDTIERQLDVADVILLNKVDLPAPDALAATRSWLNEACTEARVIETENAAVSLPVVLGSRLGAGMLPIHHRHNAPHAEHQAAILSVGYRVDPGLLVQSLADPKHDLIRSKGFVRGLDGKIYAVQTVGRRQSISPATRPPEAIGKIVCIRSNGAIDLDSLEAALARSGTKPAVGDQP